MPLPDLLLCPLCGDVVHKVSRGVQVVHPDLLRCVLLVQAGPDIEVVLLPQGEVVIKQFCGE
jgi:hypothetical protein